MRSYTLSLRADISSQSYVGSRNGPVTEGTIDNGSDPISEQMVGEGDGVLLLFSG